MVPLQLGRPAGREGPHGAQRLPAASKELLLRLRVSALACRVKPRADLFEACAALSGTPGAAPAAYVEILMRCLPEALGKEPKLHRPGVAEVSFDEAWLVAAAQAARREDFASFTFLLRSRVKPNARRNIGALIRSAAA